jgi:cell pole-organizing protein PopZ
MEEILASIRRIISEDEVAPAEEKPVAAEAHSPPVAEEPVAEELIVEDDEEPLVLEDEVLELTDRIDDEPEALASGADIDDLDFSAPPAEPEPAASVAAPLPSEEPPRAAEEPLVSAPAAMSAASAFGALERTVMMPAAGRNLEDVVRELLRPMMKDWLDQNLPGIVEAQVAAEVERIARQRR